MQRLLLFFAVLVAGCSNGAEADLQYISKARSLGAEWALINQQADAGKLTGTYTRTMRQAVRQALQTAASSLTRSDTDYGREIEVLIAAPDNAPPAELRRHADKLKQIEDSLESA